MKGFVRTILNQRLQRRPRKHQTINSLVDLAEFIIMILQQPCVSDLTDFNQSGRVHRIRLFRITTDEFLMFKYYGS